MATPLPVNKPDINELKLIALLKYNSVKIILEPQFGIRPIKLVINGDRNESFKNNWDRYSSPKNSKIIFTINDAKKINNLLNDKKALETFLNSKQAKDVINSLFGKKWWKIFVSENLSGE